MNNNTLALLFSVSLASFTALPLEAIVLPVPPLPPPVIRVVDLSTNESPIKVEISETELESNAFFRRVKTTVVFTNPNKRVMSGEFEFPLPEGAVVCGYSLEVNGVMIPGSVVEKEKARVAFESEKAKGVDPGLVEHAKGNIWRTRIFPLTPNELRRAEVEWIAESARAASGMPSPSIYEKDGTDFFCASICNDSSPAIDPIASFSNGAILWDASMSSESKALVWREKLSALPEKGDWLLVVFRNDAETFPFTDRAELLAKIDSISYDGATDIAKALACAGDAPVLLFSDELDTLGLSRPDYESRANLTIASRDLTNRKIFVRKITALPDGAVAKESKLLATVWAAERIHDLASQSQSRKDEFLELGRKYGVASEVTSLIVLENLEQYLTHKIEPSPSLIFHDEWIRRRKAADDAIEKARNDAEHLARLLELWEERVKWWNDPIPPKTTPHSGLFTAAAGDADRAVAMEAVASEGEVIEINGSTPAGDAAREGILAEMHDARPRVNYKGAAVNKAGGGGATISIKPWSADTPYLKRIDSAEDKYATYLEERKEFGSSPAFYSDVAALFFRLDNRVLAKRIISNMAELGLDNAAIWRTMGWKLREVGEYEASILSFEHVLKLRNEEGQARRDLALILAEYAKSLASTAPAAAKPLLERAMALLRDAAFVNWSRRSSRRSNDRQVAIIALEELNALISWCEKSSIDAIAPALDPAFRRDLPVKIRITLSWDADETDIDIHVLEPDGEEAYYAYRRTSTGGFVGEDVTTGYGPEEYLRKEGTGTFKILANYFASHQTALTGAVTATVTAYTDWGTASEKSKILVMRLDKPKSKVNIGQIDIK